MNHANLFSSELDKGEAFRLLAECFRLPEPGLGSKLEALEGRMARACRSAVPHVAKMRDHLETGTGGGLESLRVEYSRLFLGPFGTPAPPYGSVYLDGDRSFMGNSAMDVLDRYRLEGLGISENFHEAPDHITAELEFVYYLNSKASEAAMDGEANAPARYLEKRRHFLADHLGAWTPEFERHIEENATTDFFKHLIRATRVLIQADLEALSGGHSTPEGGQTPDLYGDRHEAF